MGSVAGVTDEGQLLLVTVDGRSETSGGMVMADVIETLRSLGAVSAVNLDGGGSTTMAMEDPTTGARSVVNASSDNPQGRIVATSLAVFARRR